MEMWGGGAIFHDDTVAATFLCFIEQRIGATDQIIRIPGRFRIGGDPDANRKSNIRLSINSNDRFGKALAQALGNSFGLRQACFRWYLISTVLARARAQPNA
jgi:hypothetical protein